MSEGSGSAATVEVQAPVIEAPQAPSAEGAVQGSAASAQPEAAAIANALTGEQPDQALANLSQSDFPMRANELPDYQDKTPREAIQAINEKAPIEREVVNPETGKLEKRFFNELGIDVTDQVAYQKKQQEIAQQKANQQRRGLLDRFRNKEVRSTEITQILDKLNNVEKLVQEQSGKIDSLSGKVDVLTEENRHLRDEIGTLKGSDAIASSNGHRQENVDSTETIAAVTNSENIGTIPDTLAQDPDYLAMMDNAARIGTEKAQTMRTKIDSGEIVSADGWRTQVEREAVYEAAEDFVQANPDKARQFAPYNESIKLALEKHDRQQSQSEGGQQKAAQQVEEDKQNGSEAIPDKERTGTDEESHTEKPITAESASAINLENLPAEARTFLESLQAENKELKGSVDKLLANQVEMATIQKDLVERAIAQEQDPKKKQALNTALAILAAILSTTIDVGEESLQG